ncbi:glucose-6-phosphate dehydrogenase assembly protein OpcA [Gordonia sp. NB41Y]|uniref:glucose-6-phosphate dehydrogenase assembly protein OpcA n=1 Tax=Gordonia sp. NB41Y TaxID=875808 RepID=UPI0006B1E6E5|nr:glucose-6-phosphate dehydrogenase assembly protein OpcA [Gordonia sp. NB41Y]EMP11177.2 oxidoreductase [Gordonia sp. NB41Y]WLP90971.1 glucose-6-phosphate dehydrogenase assembly protein OpcA [Gordonia sp. NB41Y]
MIVDLPETSTNAVAKKMVELREAGGAVSLGRVLTLVVVADRGEPTEAAIEAAIGASSEHPSRVIVLASGSRKGESRLDAQVRVGGDAGASEVVVLTMQGPLADQPHSVVTPFLLPDCPIVVWWPGAAPENPSEDPMGRIGKRRILDASKSAHPDTVLERRLAGYSPGDTDIAWTQITHWRALLASAIDRPPHSAITAVDVTGPAHSPGIDLLAGWLRGTLEVPTTRQIGSFEVRMHRPEGATVLSIDQNGNAVISVPDKPDGKVAMMHRDLPVCLAEELRRLDTDEIYELALRGAVQMAAEGAAS